jgi:DNA-binding transcriptional LysR family regulator
MAHRIAARDFTEAMADRKLTTSVDWEDLRFFAVLARQRGLAATARTLGVTPAAVTRRLAHLEATLGRPLFTRGGGELALNAAGVAALAQAEQMEFAASALCVRTDHPRDIEGRVRITVARVLADGFLAAELAPLSARFPYLEIELVATSRNLSLARREPEIALRFARPAGGALVARRVATLDYGFYASPDYAARLADGHSPVFIAFDEPHDVVPEAVWARRFLADKCVVLRANSQAAQAAAARGGTGLALLPGLVARAGGGLVPVTLSQQPPARELWLLMRADASRLARVRVVADHLVGLFHEPAAGSEAA